MAIFWKSNAHFIVIDAARLLDSFDMGTRRIKQEVDGTNLLRKVSLELFYSFNVIADHKVILAFRESALYLTP